MISLAAQLVAEEEGPSSPTVYYVSGVAHIGRGVCVDAKVAGAGLPAEVLVALDAYKLTAATDMAADLAGYAACNDVRQAVLVSMCYQLGTLADWPLFRAALAAGNYQEAAAQMLASEWAAQTPARAKREASMMLSGVWQPN
jgi:GH24 family phage-related lysozyme (muramidase)